MGNWGQYASLVKKFRRIAWWALAAGVLAFLIGPLLLPETTSGTMTEREAAGPDATFVEVNGLSVHYTSAPFQGDRSDAPLIVLLHGFGASTYSWREVLEPLSAFGEVVAYDRPAFGFTERPVDQSEPSPYGVEAQLDLLQAVIDEWAEPGQDVVLVGHSAGGTLAAEFALRYPEEVSALVLVAPALLTGGGGPQWLSPLYAIPQIDRVGPRLVSSIASSGEELLERSWHDPSLLTPDIRAGYRAPLTVAGWERAFWEFQKAPRSFQVTTSPESLSVPVLLITGDDDRVVPTSDSLAVAELLPSATLVVIPDSGHLPHEETPTDFMTAVADGWEQIRSTR